MTDARSLGRYRIVAALGHGGMAEVFLSLVSGPLGSGFTKLAVVKRLHPHLAEDPEFIEMLVDEARISARLNHANVVQTLEVGFENDQYFLAMEFLDGQPLHRIQRRAQKTGVELSASMQYLIVADALAGLQHAHELADYDGTPLGIVHRDVTPQNIFVTYDGQVKVVDFGIAKAAGRASETRQGVIKGKVRYMSPEQAVGSSVDARSDVFAAGVLLWEAAARSHFWGQLGELAIVEALVTGRYNPSPRSVDPSVPAAVDAMCRKALASNPADRYQSAAQLRADLESYLAESVISIRRALGPLVAELFSKERRALRDVIERSGKENVDKMSIATLASSRSTSSSSSSASRPPPSLSPLILSTFPASLSVKPEAPAATVASARQHRRGAMAAAIVAVGFAVLGGVLGLTGGSGGSPFASGGEGVTAAARAPAAPDTGRRELSLRSTPNRRVVDARATEVSSPISTAGGHAIVPPAAPATSATTATTAAFSTPLNTGTPPRRRVSIDTADPWRAPE